MILCSCGEEIHPKRWALGFHSCLSCGDKKAQKEIQRKSRRVMQMHKSNCVYLGSDPDVMKETILAISNMRRTN